MIIQALLWGISLQRIWREEFCEAWGCSASGLQCDGFNSSSKGRQFLVRLLELHHVLCESVQSFFFFYFFKPLSLPSFSMGCGGGRCLAVLTGTDGATWERAWCSQSRVCPSASQTIAVGELCRPGLRCQYFAFSKNSLEGRLLLDLLSLLIYTNQNISISLHFQWSRV